MSIISTNKEAKRELLHQYHADCAKQNAAERDAMNEMLDVLRDADRPMTAAQIEAACTSGISKNEIAGNLRAMRARRSRYENDFFYFGHPVPHVGIPTGKSRKDYGDGERIAIKGGGKRVATMVELDESGEVIPNSKRKVTLNESNKYSIERIK